MLAEHVFKLVNVIQVNKQDSLCTHDYTCERKCVQVHKGQKEKGKHDSTAGLPAVWETGQVSNVVSITTNKLHTVLFPVWNLTT